MEKEEQKDLLTTDDFSMVENSPLWREEYDFVDISLSPDQYESLKRGFQPDWDFRYEPHFINGYIYFSRSGYWVKKYLFEHDEEYDVYDLVECYSTDREFGRPLLAESFCEGYYEPKIWTVEDAEKYWYEYRSTILPPIQVKRKPIKCKTCGQRTVVEILYGFPTHEAGEAAERGELVLGGCCINVDGSDPEWQCTHCGQRYSRLEDPTGIESE